MLKIMHILILVKKLMIKILDSKLMIMLEWECDKSCDAGEYLDYKNCKCRKSLID